jgi:solute carrier family 35 (UDP-galactose transporter), member B1
VGGLTFGSMFCSNAALKFVNYPFVVLAKSAKIMPVFIVGSIRGIYKPQMVQYFMAIAITVGLVMFNSKEMGKLEAENILGIAMVLGSLVFDGLVSSQTDKEHKATGRDYAYPLMFSSNFVQLAANLALFTFYFFIHGDDTLQRIVANPQLMRDVIMIGLSGALG